MKSTHGRIPELSDSQQNSFIELQRALFETYEKNPVFHDAMQGKLSIEESVKELGQVNKGIKKFLPWKKNKEHNKRLEQLGELVSGPYHLKTIGIFMPDNLITAGLEFAVFGFVAGYYAAQLLTNSPTNPEEVQQLHDIQINLAKATSLGVGLVGGLLVNSINRFKKLPINEAKYLDGKIQEFYK